MELDQLRSIVRDCLGKHLHASAVFFADKLVSLSNGTPTDVYLLAQAYVLGKHYRRALNLIRQEKSLLADETFRYLAAKCLEAVQEWDECLVLLGEDEEEIQRLGLRHSPSDVPLVEDGGRQIDITAAMHYLRGRAYEALENRKRAKIWYKAAVLKDPYCYEALDRLIDGHMLTSDEEAALVASLSLGPQEQWLLQLYACKGKKYGTTAARVDVKIAELESSQLDGSSLQGNPDVSICKADACYQRGEVQQCYTITQELLTQDPHNLAALPLHLVAGLELQKKNELFLCAHRLVNEYPQESIAWYAVGCYYQCVGQYDNARRYFCKATTLDGSSAPAWIGFGHAYAAQDESDQAMAAYRTAARLFPGSHLPLLFIGMEYQRGNNLPLAEQMLTQASLLNSLDPLVYNELGVVAYRNRDYAGAAKWLRRALSLIPSSEVSDMWEPTIANLGHALRKLRLYGEAVEYYEKALALSPRNASLLSAIGFTQHLQGQRASAIDYYHKALGLKPDDMFTVDMLREALQEECNSFAMVGLSQLQAPMATEMS